MHANPKTTVNNFRSVWTFLILTFDLTEVTEIPSPTGWEDQTVMGIDSVVQM